MLFANFIGYVSETKTNLIRLGSEVNLEWEGRKNW